MIHVPAEVGDRSRESSNEQADALSKSLTETYDQESQTRITIIRDGINTKDWIPVIRRAEDEQDEELAKAARYHPNTIYERDGLYRVRNEDGHGDRVALPRKVTWRLHV